MSFRFYTNLISQASRTVAAGVFITGTLLIGFGFMIYLLPRFFATLAAIVFFVAGAGDDFLFVALTISYCFFDSFKPFYILLTRNR